MEVYRSPCNLRCNGYWRGGCGCGIIGVCTAAGGPYINDVTYIPHTGTQLENKMLAKDVMIRYGAYAAYAAYDAANVELMADICRRYLILGI